jgi:hypothetical protein
MFMSSTIRVGMSQETFENGQATEVSIGLTAELDLSASAQPDQIKRQADLLSEQARIALDRQIGRPRAGIEGSD